MWPISSGSGPRAWAEPGRDDRSDRCLTFRGDTSLESHPAGKLAHDRDRSCAGDEPQRAIEGRDPGMVAEIFASHPPTAERAADIRQWIAQKRLPGGLIRDSRRFQDVHRRVLSEVR